jgi:hypothetical protein
MQCVLGEAEELIASQEGPCSMEIEWLKCKTVQTKRT